MVDKSIHLNCCDYGATTDIFSKLCPQFVWIAPWSICLGVFSNKLLGLPATGVLDHMTLMLALLLSHGQLVRETAFGLKCCWFNSLNLQDWLKCP